MLASSGLRAWHEFDWRFLLSDPRIGPVWLAPECAGEGVALRAIGIDVVSDPRHGAEMAFVDGLHCDFRVVERTLAPATLVRIRVVRSGRLRGVRHGRSWGVADDLEGRGWEVLGRVWAAGGIDAALGYVDVDNRRAVMHWWRMLQPKGARERLTVGVRVALARIGLWRLLCREGFVFARTPR